MKTYTFDELDEQGQKAAVFRYASNPDVLSWQEEHGNSFGLISRALTAQNWRFNEHGERIA